MAWPAALSPPQPGSQFDRRGYGLSSSDEPAIGRICQRHGAVDARRRFASLTVTTLDSFADQWLMPRLKSFRRRHPVIDVRFLPSDERVDFNRHDVDRAIRYGAGHWPGLKATPLMTENLFPVCSQALMRGAYPLRRPEDLIHHTLLHDHLSFENGDVD
mgnify:CR=1 FL=1